MEGKFLRKRFNIWLFLLFLCGSAFIGMSVFLNIIDPEATGELLTFLIVGVLICLVVIPSWLLNLGAFIQIDETSIKAKYHWFGKIDCKLSDGFEALIDITEDVHFARQGSPDMVS